MLSVDKKGVGGTKFSTINPYTILHTSIYKAVLKDFVKKAASRKITRVASVAPFGACFSSKTIASTMTGPVVPTIDLVLQSKSVYWRIYGANSMVKVKENVLCLGVVDGGSKPRTSIVIGGHQLEDNMLEFDLASSKLGFNSSLLLHNTNCSHYRIFRGCSFGLNAYVPDFSFVSCALFCVPLVIFKSSCFLPCFLSFGQ